MLRFSILSDELTCANESLADSVGALETAAAAAQPGGYCLALKSYEGRLGVGVVTAIADAAGRRTCTGPRGALTDERSRDIMLYDGGLFSCCVFCSMHLTANKITPIRLPRFEKIKYTI